MCVIKVEDVYYMFAEGKNDIAHLLTSFDRIGWIDRGPLDIRRVDGEPIEPGPYGTPTVITDEDHWYLFYEREDRGIWLASSTDAQVWTHVQDDPVIPCGPDAYDRHAVALNQVVVRDGIYYGFYHANAEPDWSGPWTTCVARSTDLIHWTKYCGNPVIPQDRSSAVLVLAPDGTPELFTMHPDVRIYINSK